MGCALAAAARRMGHRVIFVTGPAQYAEPRGARVVPVVSAREMFQQVKKWLPAADVVIGAAAVSDYRPAVSVARKIKKTGAGLKISLVENPDIIAYAGAHKGAAVVVGFALETAAVLSRAREKLRLKNLDLIVANGPRSLGGELTSAWLIGRAGIVSRRENVTKNVLAGDILRESIRLRENSTAG